MPGCRAAEHAAGDPTADEVLTRLIAKTDYVRFCEMMSDHHCRGPTIVDDDDDDEYVEVPEDDAADDGLVLGEDEEDDDEGLMEARLEQAAARLRDVAL